MMNELWPLHFTINHGLLFIMRELGTDYYALWIGLTLANALDRFTRHIRLVLHGTSDITFDYIGCAG